jgi:hypothetical protein
MMFTNVEDFEFGCEPLFENAVYYREGAQDLINKLIPTELLSGYGDPLAKTRFNDLLPIVSSSEIVRAPSTLSIQLLCKYRQNACYFFSEMVSRWLLPQRRVNVELFFASDVRLPRLSDDLLSVAEIVVQIKSIQELEEIRRNLRQIESELRLGVVSHYHARRILEFKGLSSDGKTAMIQEKIGSLIQSRSKDFDKGIFSQMQHFLVTCLEDFKTLRDYHHITRIISNLYSVQKLLKQNIEVFPAKRHVIIKFLKTKLSPANKKEGGKPVLGILAGLNFLGEHEVFDQSHLIEAIIRYLPGVKAVEGSSFADRSKDASIQTNYLEVEKSDGSEFSHEEIQSLRVHLPEYLKNHVEQLIHPMFMPRNEEEVLRNIMVLARQLRFVTDMPQIIISFDELRPQEICFTVILLRVQRVGEVSIADLFARSGAKLKIVPDRIRRVGALGRKHYKEATVFRASFETRPFLRSDHSVDLYRARQQMVAQLTSAVGEVRDYNGGMIHKQNEVLVSLKQALGKTAEHHSLLLEKFFYSLTPVEMRSVMDAEHLKQLFLLLLQTLKCDLPFHKKAADWQFRQEEKRVMAVLPLIDSCWKGKISSLLQELQLPSHQIITFAFDLEGKGSAGLLLQSEDRSLQKRFLKAVAASIK